MKKQYDAVEIARYVVKKCIADELPISNLQLQNILYFIQKSFLKNKNRVAFEDDIEAWKFGPVIPKVYYRYSGFGSMPITLDLSEPVSLDLADKLIIDSVIEDFRNKSYYRLGNSIHHPLGEWYKTVQEKYGYHDIIPIQAIREEKE